MIWIRFIGDLYERSTLMKLSEVINTITTEVIGTGPT